MQFKDFKQGKLDFIRVDSKTTRRIKSKQMFLYNGEFYSSEYLAVEYFKGKGYDAFFSENTTWKNMLRLLFKDVFRKFEKLAQKKNYKRNFYDDEFFRTHEDEINERFEYLKSADLASLIEQCSINDWLKYRILKICSIVEKEKILAILYDIIRDYVHNHVGFPDLFVFNDDGYFFCEVKAKTDVLKPVQVKKHEVLLNNGIDVCVFGINKDSSWIGEAQAKYFNEDFFDEENYMEIYDRKIRIANSTYERFKGDGIDDVKAKHFDGYGLDAFIGFLNLMSDKDQIKIDNEIIARSIDEGRRVKNLRYLSKGMYYEERGQYSKAIGEYEHVETFERYARLNECYRRNRDGESQVNLIYHVLNDADDVPSNVKADFRKTARRLFRNKRSITTYETDRTCPNCGSEVILTTLHKRNNITIFTCTNDRCYWYGGVFKGNLKEFKSR